MIRATLRIGWLVIGCIAIALAMAGVVLPLLPTTPFLLVAAYAFARSSPRFHQWLMGHRHFGPLIAAWQRNRAIPRAAKKAAMVAIMLAFLLAWLFGAPFFALVLQAVVLAGVALFLLTRPDG